MNRMKGLIEFQNVTGGVCHQISEASKSMEVSFTELDGSLGYFQKNRLPEKVLLETATSGNKQCHNVHLKRCWNFAGEAAEAISWISR